MAMVCLSRLTQRTITDGAALFHNLDHPGPLAAQFDILEYSDGEVCVAVPLAIDGEIGCVALSQPVTQRHRLMQAAKILSSRSAGLLLSPCSPPARRTWRRAGRTHPRSAGREPRPQDTSRPHVPGREAASAGKRRTILRKRARHR
ncbi:hypothetical protein [Streptomyces virginiae]|uniref:hypothetical protein n=1 Tax=Streptomyces virginiae TaxID=1961 RepID=UPI003628ED7E